MSFSFRSAALWSWGSVVCVGRFTGPLAECWTPDLASLPSHSSHFSCRWWWRPTLGGTHSFFSPCVQCLCVSQVLCAFTCHITSGDCQLSKCISIYLMLKHICIRHLLFILKKKLVFTIVFYFLMSWVQFCVFSKKASSACITYEVTQHADLSK